jgi:hypothetical protein
MAELTKGPSLFDMDQKSDEAWENQSREAKAIAEEWKKAPRPFEKMMKAIDTFVAEAQKNGQYPRNDARHLLTAAEWMLVNEPKMMVDDPRDPFNPIPDWGNRYWQRLVTARDILGMDKHASMRDIIQADYVQAAKAATSVVYQEKQFQEHILDPKERAKYDSIDKQKEQYAVTAAAFTLKNEQRPNPENVQQQQQQQKNEPEEDRYKVYISEEDEYKKWKNAPKDYSSFVDDKSKEKTNEKENEKTDLKEFL